MAGSSRVWYERVVGPRGTKLRNDNGLRMLDFSRIHGLLVAGNSAMTGLLVDSLSCLLFVSLTPQGFNRSRYGRLFPRNFLLSRVSDSLVKRMRKSRTVTGL